MRTPVVVISSTVVDLPVHRQVIRDACERMGMLPRMMEHLPAVDSQALRVSMMLVDEADIYVGVFAGRYGYVPDGHTKSITEMEYDRAVRRGIPRLVFMTELSTLGDLEGSEAAEKLASFKERLRKERFVANFKEPEELRAEIIQSLTKYRPLERAAGFHFVSDIPEPPEPYVAHQYTLLASSGVIGRKLELKLLSDWIRDPIGARILTIAAIGGMGKSALIWK